MMDSYKMTGTFITGALVDKLKMVKDRSDIRIYRIQNTKNTSVCSLVEFCVYNLLRLVG